MYKCVFCDCDVSEYIVRMYVYVFLYECIVCERLSVNVYCACESVSGCESSICVYVLSE